MGVRLPRGAVPGDPVCCGRSGITGIRAPASVFPLPLLCAASRRRPSPASGRSTGGPRGGVEGRSGRWGCTSSAAVLPLRGGVLSEDSDQAVSLLLMQPSPSSCEYNFIYRPIFIHLSTSGCWRVGARTLTLQNDYFSFLPNLLGCAQDILHLDGRAFPPHSYQSRHS